MYDNQQRFLNFTKEAIGGIYQQLDKISLITWQNRMLLDMLLVEKGGVCRMFGDMCCTFIPNNTAPDGSITKELDGLTSLSAELAEHSGFSDPLTGWLQDIFGKWAGSIKAMISVAVMIAILITCGCCCIPCLRGLLQRLIDTAVTKSTMLYERVPTTDDHRGDYENAAQENVTSDLTDDDSYGNLFDEDEFEG